jgi:para-aminobenzoate synthetase component 1
MPLITEITYHDPVAVFAPFAAMFGSIFLDSAKPSPELGRYSYIAIDPFLILRSKNCEVELDGQTFLDDPWVVLKKQLSELNCQRIADLPMLQGGAIGYFSYDLGRHLEKLPDTTLDDFAFPDLLLGFYDVIISFDHVLQKAWIVSTGLPEKTPAGRAQKAAARTQEWLQRLTALPELAALPTVVCSREAIQSNFDRQSYERAVHQVMDSISAGDIFEANIAQRFSVPLPEGLTPFELYRRLRTFNAAPFASFLNFDDVVLASASPERFLRLAAGEVESRPIKGTSPRFAEPAADQASAAALLASEKDQAENVMIVDLMRNDLSRVCEDHSVQVPKLCGLESFATVHHLVSVVTAKLRAQRDAVDLLCATFPGGSITGAPKVRAMEIIDDIEPHRRGPYCGSVGFIGFNGDMDTSITIRTYAIKDRQLSFHAGGAIVIDSDPAAEYQETLDKAAAMYAALCKAVDF